MLALLLTSSLALIKSLYLVELVFIFHLLEEHLEYIKGCKLMGIGSKAVA